MAKEAVKPTKVIVRLLPPLITEDELMSTIGDEHRGNAFIKNFVPGRRVKGEDKPSRNATCYMYFGDADQADLFVKDYHGHAFVDDQGEHFRAVACFAPYQKVPKQKTSKDSREGTIEEDPTYKQFAETLGKPKEAFVAPEDPRLAAKPLDPASTPLLQHLRDRAKERKERAEKKANKKWKGQMDSIGEDEEASSSRKKAKWLCGECGTSKSLEEDPDDRGSFYCTRCWESWETTADYAKPKKKKKKKYYEEEEVEESSSARKSRKKREREAAAAADWYAEEASKDQAGDGRRRRKKKEKDEEWWDEASGSYWKESDEGYSREKKSKSKREKWVAVDGTEKKPKGEEDPPASRWRKKGASTEEEAPEEKPRRNRKSKAKEDDYWY